MRKPEQKLYDAMKRNRPYTVWLQRVENLVGEGIPDVYVAGPSTTCWVETKSAKRPKRAATRLMGVDGLRPSQINWFLKAGTKAIRAYILIDDDQGGLWLVDGVHALVINDWPVSKLDEESLATDWDSIYKVLLNWED